MTLLWCDDFNSYGFHGEGLMTNGVYAEAGGSIENDPDPTASGNLVLFVAQAIGALDKTGSRWVLPETETVIGVAGRIWLPNLPNSSERAYPIRLTDTSNRTQCSLTITNTGALQLLFGGSGGYPLATSAARAIVANAWNHVEAKITANTVSGVTPNADGAIEVRVNGVTVLDVEGIQTCFWSPAVFAQVVTATVGEGSGQQTGRLYLKDYIIWNTDGVRNNDFFGSVQVVRRTLTGDETLGTWVPSTGSTGYNILTAIPPNDTRFLAAPIPPGIAASFTLSTLPTDITSVRGMMAMVRSAKVDGGDGNLQVALLSEDDAALGANRPITSAFTYWYDIFETDPATGTAWTVAGAEDARVQIDRTV